MDIGKAHTKKGRVIMGVKGWMIDAQWIGNKVENKIKDGLIVNHIRE